MICRKCKKRFHGDNCPYCGTPGSPGSGASGSKGPRRWGWFLIVALVAAVVAGVVWGIWRSQSMVMPNTPCINGGRHKISLETVEAHCTQNGYTMGTCRKCGYTYMYDMSDALGHQWEEPVSVKSPDCMEDGIQNISCGCCAETREEVVDHFGHNYEISSGEEESDGETVTYLCTLCGDMVIQNWDDPPYRELKESAYLPDQPEDFTFLVNCDQGIAYLLDNLVLTGESGAVSYTVAEEESGVYRIKATEPYVQYQTYYARSAGDLTFPEYNAKALEFDIIGPDRAEIEFNDDNLIFLKTLELEQYGSSGAYELKWDEPAQCYYLTLLRMETMDPAAVGKVIAIGDYTSTDEILQDGSRELHFAKLERISHNADGQLLLEMTVPELSDIYDKLDIYFSGKGEELTVKGDPEAAFVNAVINSDDFTAYIATVHLAANSYAQDHGFVVTSLAENAKENLKFELTDHSLTPGRSSGTCNLVLGGKIIYKVPMKSESGHTSGSIVVTCNAKIESGIAAGGRFKDKSHVDLHLTNNTTTTLSFGVEFNLEYSYDNELTYLVHNTTHTIHTSTCRIANKQTNSANLQKVTAQELSEMYNGDKEVMKAHECKVCLAVSGLDGTAYVYNKNTGVLHCMNCRHVDSIKECNLYTLHPDNTLNFTTCEDCRPQDRQVKDFDNRMRNALKGSDLGVQMEELQKTMKDAMGKKKPSASEDPDLAVPINIAGVFNIEIGVDPVFEFDLQASVKFTISNTTENTYGIRSVGKDGGFETYSVERADEDVDEANYQLEFNGELTVKFGIQMSISAYPVGCEDFACIRISGQIGLYGHFTGVFVVEGTVGGDTDTYCAARLEAGLYVKIDGYWKILWFDDTFTILKEQRLPLLKWGYDRVYYAFEEEQIELTADDPSQVTMINLPMIAKAKYMQLPDMKYGTQSIFGSKMNVQVDIRNEDGSPCTFLEYLPENGMLYKAPGAPETFSVVITVQATPKVRISNLKEFLNSQTKEITYGASMDPLEIKLNVVMGDKAQQREQYSSILDMYYNSISEHWENCDGDGWDTVGDPDNACYLLWHYESDLDLSEVGYVLLDINGDGQLELLISTTESAKDGFIYDMYTVVNGEILHVISGGERDRYYLAEDNSINNDGSSSAFTSSHDNYRLDSASGTLKIIQAAIYDEYEDEDNPWFHATEDYYDGMTGQYIHDVMTPISEEAYRDLVDSFPENTVLKLTPFSQYTPASGSSAGAFRGSIQDFLVQKQYLPLWEEAFGEYAPAPEEYGVFDLDQDGNQELLICGYEFGKTWASFLLFEHSSANNTVTRVAMDGSDIPDFSEGYSYILDRYSPEYHALVIIPVQYTQNTAVFEFWTKNDSTLEYFTSMGWDTDDDEAKYFFIGGERCTEEEKDKILNENTVWIKFNALP